MDEKKGHTLYFHSSLSHGEKAAMKENYNISDDDLECIVGVYGNYYNRSYSNAIQSAISNLGDAADRLNISNLRNENNIFILFEISQ